MADIVSIDNVALTGFVCSRRTAELPSKERKFKAKCGSKVTFVLSASGQLKRIDYGREQCKEGCIYCDVMALDGKKIVIGS